MKTILYGAGATARMAAEILGDRLAGVVADGKPQPLRQFSSLEPHMLSRVYPKEEYEVLICIGYQHGGMNLKRRQIFELLGEKGYCFYRLYPQQPGNFYVGWGSFILPNVIFHDNSRVGENCFVSSGTVIGHDAVIHDHSWVNANVSIDGGATVGNQCVIGAGAVIGAGVTLGDRTLVGPGAVILHDTEPDSVWLAPAAEKHRFSSNVFGRMQA